MMMSSDAAAGSFASLLVTILLLFVAGYSTQRSSVCAVAAAQEIIDERRANRLIGFFLSAAASLIVMTLDESMGNRVFANFHGALPGLATVAGAMLFALGAWRNGRCAMGTLAALAAGSMPQLGTLAGLLAGIAIGTRLFHAWLGDTMMGATIASPLTGLPLATIAIGAVAIAIILATALIVGLRGAPRPQFWSPVWTMLLIGGASGGLFALNRNWPYTSLFGDVVRGGGMDIGERFALTLVILVGSYAAARTGGLFRRDWGNAALWWRTTSSGMIMGVGASLVPGGNEAMLLTGLPLLLPNLVLAYLVLILTLIALFALNRRRAPLPVSAAS